MNDLGNYTAVAENPAGKDQTFCSVFVKLMPNIDDTPLVNPDAFRYLDHPHIHKPRDTDEIENVEPPKVVVPLQDLQLKEGEPIILMCKITGNPKPKVIKLHGFLK